MRSFARAAHRPPSALWLAALLVLAVPLAAAEGFRQDFVRVGEAIPFPRAFDVHEGELVWARPATGAIEIVHTDLGTMRSEVLTTVASNGAVRLVDLRYDGRWVAWCDDRFENFDIFAFDTWTGELRRVTADARHDIEMDLRDGALAWSREGQVWTYSVSEGALALVATGPGQAKEPALAGDRLLWVRVDEGAKERYIMVGDRDGSNATPLGRTAGAFAHSPATDGTFAVWSSHLLVNASVPEQGFGGYMLQMASIGTASPGDSTVQNVTFSPVAFGRLRVSDGNLSWLQESGTAVVLRRFSTGPRELTQTLTRATGFAASSTFAVIMEQDSEHGVALFARPWVVVATPPDTDVPPAGFAVGLLGLLAAALARRRRGTI